MNHHTHTSTTGAAVAGEPQPTASESGRLRRTWTAVTGAMGAVLGVVPHVLHHVGPLAGAAIVAGTTGTLVFGALGLLLSIPMLLRLYRRFGTWRAPAAALAAFAVAFTISTVWVGPTVRGSDGTSTGTPAGHLGHHAAP